MEYYNLDMIISVGYRVKSERGVLFRHLASIVLKEHLLRGHTINQRLYQIEDRFDRRLSYYENRLDKHEQKHRFLCPHVPADQAITCYVSPANPSVDMLVRMRGAKLSQMPPCEWSLWK